MRCRSATGFLRRSPEARYRTGENDLLRVASTWSDERFDEERGTETPLLVLRAGALALSPAPDVTRGPAGATRSPDGASRDERQECSARKEARAH